MDINIMLGLILSGLLFAMALVVLAIVMIRYVEISKEVGRRRREMLKARLHAHSQGDNDETELRKYTKRRVL